MSAPLPNLARRDKEVAQYLATGEHDPQGWRLYEGQTSLEMMTAHNSALRSALVQRVVELEAEGEEVPPVPARVLEPSWKREKLRPMVEGLFMLGE